MAGHAGLGSIASGVAGGTVGEVKLNGVFSAAMIELCCPECAELQAFEQPPCVDGHGLDCPEWFCLNCGMALLIDAPVEPVDRRPRALRFRAA